MSHPVPIIVLAGGSARRFGTDKLAATIGGRTILEHCLAGMPPAMTVVGVGPKRSVELPGREVSWTREDPAGGGPLAAIAAGLSFVDSNAEIVAVAPGDTPRAGEVVPDLIARLECEPSFDAVLADGGDGVTNPLLAAYRVPALRSAVARSSHNRPARDLLALAHVTLRLRVEITDIDTPADLAAYVRMDGGREAGR